MRRNVFVLTSALLVIGGGLASATPGDPFNPLAPTFTNFIPPTPMILARGPNGVDGGVVDADGAFFQKISTAPPFSAWTQVDQHYATGFSSNAVGASFGGAPLRSRLFARDAAGDLVWSVASNSQFPSNGPWTSFGTPPGGTTSSPAAAGLPGGPAMVAVRGANNLPYFRVVTSTGQLGLWNHVGSTAITSAPGIAMSLGPIGDVRAHVVSLRSGGAIQVTQCNLGSCGAWTDLPGGGVGISQPTATWIASMGPGAGPWLAVAVIGTNFHAFVILFNSATGTWSGWSDRGGICDSPVAVHPPLTLGGEPLLVVKGTGAISHCVNTAGQIWNCLSAP